MGVASWRHVGGGNRRWSRSFCEIYVRASVKEAVRMRTEHGERERQERQEEEDKKR